MITGSITKIKEKEKVLIDGITKHSQKLQNERKTVKKMFSEIKSQIDKSEKTIMCLLCLDEIQYRHTR
jgi:ribosomal protein L24